MLTDQPSQLSLAQLFDTLPDAVAYFRAVYDESGQVVDFVADYANPAGKKYLASRYQVVVGTPIRYNNRRDASLAERTFLGLLAVAESGQPTEHEYFSTTLNEWLLVSRAKADRGVLSIVRFTSAHKRLETELQQQARQVNTQNDLLQSILDTSLSNIFVYEALRNPGADGQPGPISDLRVRLVNNQARLDTITWTGTDPVGNTLLGINPDSRESGQFNLYCQVIETGQSIQTEQFYPTLQVWFDTLITKLNDGCLVTGINITAQKQAALANQQQTELLNKVLDSSSSGIKALEAIRDPQGNISDFTIRLINTAGASIRGRLASDLIGKRLTDVFPGLHESGLFSQYVMVAQTGHRRYLQTRYGDAWYDMAITAFGDGVVITYTDITDSRHAKLMVERTATENQQQAELLNSVLDSSNNGIMAFEAIRNADQRILDFRFLIANQASVGLVGKTIDEMIGKNLLTLFPGNVESGLFALYSRTTETGEPGRTEVHYNLDGLDFWLDISTQKLRDGFVVTFTDVSAVKRAAQVVEQAAIASQQQTELLNTVLDNSQTAISLHEAIRSEAGQIVDFRALLANSRAIAMWGHRADAILNQPFFAVTTPEQQTVDFPKYVGVVETGEPDLAEFNIGGQRLLRLTAKSGDGVVISNIDITEIYQLRQRLETSATELQTVIDTSQTGIFLFSPIRDEAGHVIDFRFRVANRMLAAYVGQQPDAVIGALGSTWFPGYKTNGLFAAYYKTYATGEPQRFDFHYDVDGIDVWLDIMSTKVGDEVLVTFGDYTPLKKLQQQLEASIVDLKRSNANLEQFAYVASHDLQEPLRKIQAFGDIIHTQYAPLLGTQGTDLIQRMQSAAARMQLLIKDVLAYSRIATRRENLDPVSLGEVVKEVLDNLETAIADTQAIISVGPLPTITGDAPQLRQLMQNLLSNALKFVKPGITPRVSVQSTLVRGGSSGLVVLPPDAARLFHLIELQDNGIGFEPHHAERIFQVFQRLHNRSSYEGTGIGLAIVHKVVENHQGYIDAKSNSGEGALFRILLPVTG